MLVMIKKELIFVNILVFVICDLIESKKAQDNSGHVIITHLGLVPYEPVKEEDIYEPEDKMGGYYKAEIFDIPVNGSDTHSATDHFMDSNTTFMPVDQNLIKNTWRPLMASSSMTRLGNSAAVVPVSFSFQVGKHTTERNTPRLTRRADFPKFKRRRLADGGGGSGGGGGGVGGGNVDNGEQISTGPIRITSPNDDIKVDGYLKGEVITGLNRPTKLKVEDPPPGWKPLIKPGGGFTFETTKSKLKYTEGFKDPDTGFKSGLKNRLGPQPGAGVGGALNQITGNVAAGYYPLRRNPFHKPFGYPTIVELPPERSYYIQRDPALSYGPGFYSNYYPNNDRFSQNYYFNGGLNRTGLNPTGPNPAGLNPTERFGNRFESGFTGFRNPHSGFGSTGPSPRFSYASLYPTDFENDEFYTRIQNPGFDNKLDFPALNFMEIKTNGGFAGKSSPPTYPVNQPSTFGLGSGGMMEGRAGGGLGIGLGGGGGGSGLSSLGLGGGGSRNLGGVGGGDKVEVSKNFETEVQNAGQDKNLFNVHRTVDTQENFGTKTEFY